MKRSRWPVLLVVAAVVLAVPGVVAVREAATLRRLGSPVHRVTTDAPAPAPLRPAGPPVEWTATAGGRITDAAVLPSRGLVIYVEEVAHRSWKATAVDAHTGAVRWSNARGHTGHIEAWTVTDAAVVLAYHHSASRLAWRTHRAASFEGLDPRTGEVLWTRHVYNLLGERPGDFASSLASPTADIVYARSEAGVPWAVDTRTGKTLWEYPALGDCRTSEVMAGRAGVAVTQRCPRGKERVALVNPRTGLARWKLDISTPELRLLAVGTNSVVVHQGGLVQEVVALGPGGRTVSRIPCRCGDGDALSAAAVGGDTLAGGIIGPIGIGGVVVVGGPFGLVGLDADTGALRWETGVPGGPVHRVLDGAVAGEGEVHVVGGDGALVRVDPADGALRVVVPAGSPALAPDSIVVPAAGYLLAGSGKALTFRGPV